MFIEELVQGLQGTCSRFFEELVRGFFGGTCSRFVVELVQGLLWNLFKVC